MIHMREGEKQSGGLCRVLRNYCLRGRGLFACMCTCTHTHTRSNLFDQVGEEGINRLDVAPHLRKRKKKNPWVNHSARLILKELLMQRILSY